MTKSEQIQELVNTLKQIRSLCESPNPNIDRIHAKADEAIYEIEENQ